MQGLYVNTAIKLLMGFVTFVVQIQLAGKGNIAPHTIMDQMQNFVLGGIIGGVIYNQDITLLQFFNVLLIWTLIVLITKYLTNHFPLVKKMVDGSTVLVVYQGQVLVDNVTKAGISANDLSYKLRTSGVADIREVERAILELNGQLTIVKQGETNIKFPLVMDGKISEEGLDIIRKDADWLKAELNNRGYNPEDVYMANYVDGRLIIAAYRRGKAIRGEQR